MIIMSDAHDQKISFHFQLNVVNNRKQISSARRAKTATCGNKNWQQLSSGIKNRCSVASLQLFVNRSNIPATIPPDSLRCTLNAVLMRSWRNHFR